MPATTNVTPTGDPYVDGVIVGTKWATTSLTYSFPASASFYGANYGSGEPSDNFGVFNPAQQAAVQTILGMYSAASNLTFTEVTETSSVHGDIRYAMSNAPSTAWGYYPSTAPEGGDAWFNQSSGWYTTPTMGTYGFDGIIHETGHTLGLKHPQDVFGSFGAMPVDHDSLEYTVMSYRSYIGASTTSGYTNAADSYPQSLMMYDIAAVQALYGANYTTNSGDTVYSWSANTGQEFINGVAQSLPVGNKIFMTIWDGGGNDTYSFANYTTNISVDLRPGDWSTASSAQLANLGNGHSAAGNVANALLYNNNPASLIENAIGGSGNDTLIGNAADNHLTGGAGNDSLDGQGGTNTAVYSGANTNYAVVDDGNGSWTVTDLRGGSPDGTDTLTNIEYLQFSNETVAIAGTPVNHAPVANADALTTVAGIALSVSAANGVLANDTDADGNALTAVLVTGPAYGTLNLASDGSLTFTPNSGFVGTTSFTYEANDGTANSAVVTDTITVTAAPVVNHAPVAVADTFTTVAGTPLVVSAPNGVLANDTDADGNHLTATLVSSPTNGTLNLATDGSLTFTANSGFVGTTSFTYEANDGTANSTIVTDSITVTAAPVMNHAPVAVADTFTTVAGTPLVVSAANGVLANDTDADANHLTATLVSGPANGTLSLAADGSLTFTPNSGFVGTTSFAYEANDGTTSSAIVTDSVTVTAPPVVNHAPVAVSDAFRTAAGTPLVMSAANGVLANDCDADGNHLTATLVSGPANGTLNLASDGSFTFTPNSGFSGTTSFTYEANDGSANSNVMTDSITVAAPVVANHPPVAVADTFTTQAGTALTVSAANGVLTNDTDADGNHLTATLVSGTANGALNLAPDGSFTFTPNSGFSGTTSFTYEANDGSANSNVVTDKITVVAPNVAPVARNDEYSDTTKHVLSVSAAAGLLANDTDANGNPLTVSLVKGPSSGSLHLNPDGSFVFTPSNITVSGTVSFTYQTSDGHLNSSVATVTLDVAKLAALAPKIDQSIGVANDSYAATKNTALKVDAQHGVLANDIDTAGHTMKAVLVSGSTSGLVALNTDGSFTFTPKNTFTGTTTFTYKVTDGTGTSTTATATINVGKGSGNTGADNHGAGSPADSAGLIASLDSPAHHGGPIAFDFGQIIANQAMADAHSTGSSLISSVQLLLSEFDHHDTSVAGLDTPDNMPAPADYLPDPLNHFSSEFHLA